jgi:hypothetical protein
MTVTPIEICNSALVKLGAAIISDIDEEKREAQLCKILYARIRDEVLRAHPWNFAIKRASLYPTATTPEFEYGFSYDIPADNLRILTEEFDDTDYVIENGKILSNEPTMKFRYVYRNEDESTWDTLFAEAFAWKLARELSLGLVQAASVADSMEKGYRATLSEARAVDGQEGIIKPLVADKWIRARY